MEWVAILAFVVVLWALGASIYYPFANTTDGYFVWIGKYLGGALAFLIAEVALIAAAYFLCSAIMSLSERAGRAHAIYLRQVNKERLEEYGENLGGAQVSSALIVSLVSLVVLVVARRWLALPLTPTLSVVHALGLLAFFATLVVEYKKRDRWEFYQARRLALPYVVGASACIAIVSYVVYSLQVGAATLYQWLGVWSPLRGETLAPPWAIPFRECSLGLAWGLAAAIAVIWSLPLVLKKDWAALGCLALGASSPFLVELVIPRAADYPAVKGLFAGLPAPAASVLLGLVAGWLLDKLRGGIEPDLECTRCGASITPPARFCPLCAHPLHPMVATVQAGEATENSGQSDDSPRPDG